LLWPHINEQTVNQLIKRIITEVNKWNNEQHYTNLALSLSFGYSALYDSDNFEDIIAQADRNMCDYKKKLTSTDC